MTDQNNKKEETKEENVKQKKESCNCEKECKCDCGEKCECEKTKKECEEWKEKYLRSLADYHNLEKRFIFQFEEIQNRSNKNLLLKFLEVQDNLEKAEIFIKDPGLKMIKDSFVKILKSEGVEEMDLLKKEYNPEFAECIEVEAGDKDNIVTTIVQKGYLLKGNLLRIAQVKVSKKSL